MCQYPLTTTRGTGVPCFPDDDGVIGYLKDLKNKAEPQWWIREHFLGIYGKQWEGIEEMVGGK